MHESHIQAAIICAKTQGLQMKIRSGGHDFEGVSYVSDVPFFILDMFNLRSINVSIEDETAWVQAGATVGEVYYRIYEKSNTHGFPAGVCPTVGVGGHFSGGGYGNMLRKYGLSEEELLAMESFSHTKSSWCVSQETVTVFRVQRTLEQNATDVVYRWQQVADKLHEDIFIRMIIDVVNSSQSGEKTIRARFFALFLGDSQRLFSLMNQSFPELGLKETDCGEMSWVESVLYWYGFPPGKPVNILLSRNPRGLTHLKRKSDYLKEPIPKDGLKYIFERMIELETPVMMFNPYGGRMSEIPESAKPFPHRAGNICKIQYATNWIEDGIEASNHYLNLTKMLYAYMTPFVSKFPREAYLNYRDLDLGINHNGPNSYVEGAVYGITYFKGNYNRLVQVKTKVDPDNFFRNEQSIPTLPSWRK
ncbi:hypothetical protein F0562_024065 [Nyssa sinensis]|uniref:FAD-binding PCMH-type domain-containing protein n=1 Tax=Nyssa sinensis TaxID=561372 RepID=A0A5J5BKZ7_9ASTE|nr:hypothetical protein F0562_024065 [Nyssa sinensis]